MMATEKHWEPSGHKCPLCKHETEMQRETVQEGGQEIIYNCAERCKPCGWLFRFDD